ncbi:diguanylate cyclase [Pseudomonas putida]|nr:diguanylate cyclase [Pseudomonas putida]
MVLVGAGLSGRRTAANTGVARARHRGVFFAGKPAPTESGLAFRF